MRKTALLLLCLSFFSATAFSQDAIVSFGYDANGNRISRTLEILRMRNVDSLPNGFTKDTVFMFEIEQEAIGDSLMSVYPNPTNDRFTVICPDNDQTARSAFLFDAKGNLIERRDIASRYEEFDLGEKPAGVYVLMVSCNKTRQIWKVIKR